MGDLVDVVAVDLLELREERAQIAKPHDEKDRSQEEKKVLTALDFMGEVIAGQCQLKLKGGQEVDAITETAVLEVQEANKIREIYSAICESPGKPSETDLRETREIENTMEIFRRKQWGE